jgi:hypothetical protein
MALDHFVSQVHLRNFYSPALGERMYAVRKSDGKAFTPNSESVCRIEAGNTNAYLTEDRLIEQFLKSVEPRYNPSVKRLAAGDIDPECVYVVAGFASYIKTCSPGGMRIQAASLKATLESSARVLDAAGALGAPPESLGGANLSELLQDGKLGFKVDPKYPQAIGVANVLKMTSVLGNCAWDILLNPHGAAPFFTSDYPVAIEDSGDPRVINSIVPLTPTLSVRIQPDLSAVRSTPDFTFANFRFRIREISRAEAVAINELLVRCAEDVVFYRDHHAWVKPFIAKRASFRIETVTRDLPTPKGSILLARQRIVRRPGF